jgi:hypothetical protein
VVEGPDGERPVAYTNVTRTWIDCKLATTQWLRFQIPATVLPLAISEARVTLSIRAPSRRVELLVPAGADRRVVLELTHPIGNFSCTLDDPALLRLDEQGGLLLALKVGDDEAPPERARDQISQAAWRVEEVHMEITGTVQGEGHE